MQQITTIKVKMNTHNWIRAQAIRERRSHNDIIANLIKFRIAKAKEEEKKENVYAESG